MSEDNDKICLVDMDGTIADYEAALKRDLNKLAGPGEPEWDIHRNDLPDFVKKRMWYIKRLPGWWEDLELMEDGFLVMEMAERMGFRSEILTKGPMTMAEDPSSAWQEKVNWCRKTIDGLMWKRSGKGPIDITVTMDKSRHYGRVLVEDFPPYLLDWLKYRKRGLGIIMHRSYNAGFTHPQVVRYKADDPDSIKEVESRLREQFER